MRFTASLPRCVAEELQVTTGPRDILLAADFLPPRHEEWRALVDGVLKGRAFEKLVARTYDGLPIQPLYTADTAAEPLAPAARPGAARSSAQDVVADTAIADPAWDMRAMVDHPDPGTANSHVLQALEGGATSILIRLDPSGQTGIAVGSGQDLSRVLAGVQLELAGVALDAGLLGPAAASWLAETAKASPRARLAFNIDPLGAFAEGGRSPGPIDGLVDLAAAVGVRHGSTYPDASLFLASGRVIHDGGGAEAQELGFMAACALAYAKALVAAGLPMGEAFGRIVVGLSADAEYFTTIAKLRAARAIWARLTSACGSGAPARIEARSSRRMLSRLDPWVNLLRLAAAGFGGAVGGADALVLDAFTQPLGRASAFARRQARNMQLILMEEAQIGRVLDPAGGVWFLEALTDQLARAGWAVFQAIEQGGGVVRALADGYVAQEVANTRRAREADIASLARTLVGVSAFPNLAESGVEIDEVDPTPFALRGPDVSTSGADSECAQIAPYRESEPFERFRAEASARSSEPAVYLACLGTPAEYGARVAFARDLFAAAGLTAEIGEPEGYSAQLAPVAVLCGSDPLYQQRGPQAARHLKAAGARRVYLAGRPGGAEAPLRDAGVDRFVFMGGDAVADLRCVLDDSAAQAPQ